MKSFLLLEPSLFQNVAAGFSLRLHRLESLSTAPARAPALNFYYKATFSAALGTSLSAGLSSSRANCRS
jgi:hypothetical protein